MEFKEMDWINLLSYRSRFKSFSVAKSAILNVQNLPF